MKLKVKRILIGVADAALAVYLFFAFTAFNKPDEQSYLCKEVNITIADKTTNGFIDEEEVMKRLNISNLQPKGKPLKEINCRQIEEVLISTPFVKTANCYKTQDCNVNISITQRMPIIRIMSVNGDDYYIDDQDCVMMPNSQYTSDLIIATGFISQSYAKAYLSPLARVLMDDDFSRNLIEQINVSRERDIEFITRLGGHVVYLGRLPESNLKCERNELITEFIHNKIHTLELFYRHGLNIAGWNKYSVINLEFNNQVVCKKKKEFLNQDI